LRELSVTAAPTFDDGHSSGIAQRRPDHACSAGAHGFVLGVVIIRAELRHGLRRKLQCDLRRVLWRRGRLV
jgi:hypothetical protein